MHRLIVSLLVILTFLMVPTVAAQNTPTTFVRFAHFAPDTGAVDMSMNGSATDQTGIEFGSLSDWMPLTEAGPLNLSFAPTGSDQAALSLDNLELGDGWYTVVITGQADALSAEAIQENHQDTAPGVAQVTFVNALPGDTQVNFERDGVPFVTELGTVGNAEGLLSSSTVPVDAGTYTIRATATNDPQNVIGEQSVDIVETSAYLIAAVPGRGTNELMINETPLAQSLLLRGELSEPGTLIEAMQANDQLAPFAEAVETAGLTEELSGEGPYTIFAPIDFAMDDLMQQYSGDAEGLANALRGYIVEGNLKSMDVFNAESLTTLAGTELAITPSSNTVAVNGADVLEVNIPATNGTIHLIGTGDMMTDTGSEDMMATPEATAEVNGG